MESIFGCLDCERFSEFHLVLVSIGTNDAMLVSHAGPKPGKVRGVLALLWFGKSTVGLVNYLFYVTLCLLFN